MNKTDFEFDSWVTETLRSARPAPDAAQGQEVIDAILNPQKRPLWARPTRWMVISGLVLAGIALLLHPAPSIAAPTLEQVDAAAQAQGHYSLTRKYVSGKFAFFWNKELRDGERWKISAGTGGSAPMSEVTMDGTRTTTISRRHGEVDVFYDGPTKSPRKSEVIPTPQNFFSMPSELFRGGPGKVTSTPNVEWKGRQADRFVCVVSFKGSKGGSAPLKQIRTLYADPTTHLPLEIDTAMAGVNSLTEVVTYDFSPAPDDAFEVKVPAGAKEINLPTERATVQKALTPRGLVIFDSHSSVGIFLPTDARVTHLLKSKKLDARIKGYRVLPLWMLSQPKVSNQTMLFGGAWGQKAPSLKGKKTVQVWLNGKLYVMPLKKVGDVGMTFPHQTLSM